MYQRKIIDILLSWKQREKRKPILLDGARQTGKTYLLRKIFGQNFRQVVALDFLEEPELAEIFEGKKTPEYLIEQICYTKDVEFDPATDLLILDEIGECQDAIDSLKFFAEKAPEMYVCASGSNIGLLSSFPVGKVTFVEMHPMSFEEFLMAGSSKKIFEGWRSREVSPALHGKLFQQLKDYYFVGGMPEAVSAWFGESDLREKVGAVTQVHSELISGYVRDFGKYSELGGRAVNAMHIETVFRSVPLQLREALDGSVQRYRFKEVLPRKNRYRDLQSPIDWLVKAHLVSKNYLVETPSTPLAAQSKENMFKLFLHDVGLLGHMLGLKYESHQDQDFDYKGYVAESFVQNEMLLTGYKPTFGWSKGKSELEFLYTREDGSIMPVEVKSGQKTQAKSLAAYTERYRPQRTLKLIGAMGSNRDPDNLVLPLYYASHIADL